jgi:hypothetical protein
MPCPACVSVLQPLRAVSIKAAAEDVQVANNGAVGASGASNMLDFEELSDILRCARDPGRQWAVWAVHRMSWRYPAPMHWPAGQFRAWVAPARASIST